MRKIFIFIVTTIMLATIFMSVHGEKEKVTISVWDYFMAQSKYYENEINLFQEKYPWIEIKRTKQVNLRYKELLNLAARSDNLPDLFTPKDGNVIEDIEHGWIQPVDQWATPEWKKRFPKGVFVNGVHIFEGKTYLVPFSKQYVWHQLYINKKVFRDSGLVDKKGNILHPKTWAEYREFARIITKKGNGKFWGIGIAAAPEHLFPHAYYEWARWAGAAGGDHVEMFEMDYRVGKYTFDNPAYVKVFQLLLSIKKDGSIIPGFLSMDDELLKVMFGDGKIGMIEGGIWNQVGWKTTHPGWLDYECIPEPAPDEKGYRCMQCVSPEPQLSSYMMSKNCKHPNEAWLFIDWLTTPEAGARWAKSGNSLSIYPEANKNPDNTIPFNQYADICNDFLRWSPNPIGRNPQLSGVKLLNKPTPTKEALFWGIMSGQIKEKDIAKSLKEMNDKYNALLQEAVTAAQNEGYKVSMKDFLFPDWDPTKNYGQ